MKGSHQGEEVMGGLTSVSEDVFGLSGQMSMECHQ